MEVLDFYEMDNLDLIIEQLLLINSGLDLLISVVLLIVIIIIFYFVYKFFRIFI